MSDEYTARQVWRLLENYTNIKSLAYPQATRMGAADHFITPRSTHGDNASTVKSYSAVTRDGATATRRKEDLTCAALDLEAALATLGAGDYDLIRRYFIDETDTTDSLALSLGYTSPGGPWNRMNRICGKLARRMNGD